MASVVSEDGLTLAPFRRIYEERELALLTDAYFKTGRLGTALVQPQPDEPATPNVVQLPNRAQFDTILARWLNDTAFDSLPDEMKEYDSFNEIVSMGSRVVPLIAANLRRSPSFLFLALEEIFGEDPVPEEAFGNLQATVSSWLQWLQR